MEPEGLVAVCLTPPFPVRRALAFDGFHSAIVGIGIEGDSWPLDPWREKPRAQMEWEFRYTPVMSITAFGEKTPVFGQDAFVHPDATVIGDVVLEDGANVWPGAVLRGDLERIVLGAQTSFQDNSVAHTDLGYPLIVGEGCVIGHGVIVHGATVGARCLVGMGSTLLNGCEVGDDCVIGAGALLTQGKEFPPRSLIVGVPAKVARKVTEEDLAVCASLRQMYVEHSRRYAELGLGAVLSAFRR